MAARRDSSSKPDVPRRRPATTPEARENQLIAMAFDAAEAILQQPNPPAQIVTHYLKLGSSREKLEQQRLEMEVSLLEAKREALASAARVEELYENAINAMRSYQGAPLEMPDEF